MRKYEFNFQIDFIERSQQKPIRHFGLTRLSKLQPGRIFEIEFKTRWFYFQTNLKKTKYIQKDNVLSENKLMIISNKSFLK